MSHETYIVTGKLTQADGYPLAGCRFKFLTLGWRQTLVSWVVPERETGNFYPQAPSNGEEI